MVSASASRSSSQSKSSKEKSSRSPLRATTLESNVKKSNRVEFREPLASYRLVLGQFTVKEKYAKIRCDVFDKSSEVDLPPALPHPQKQQWCWTKVSFFLKNVTDLVFVQ